MNGSSLLILRFDTKLCLVPKPQWLEPGGIPQLGIQLELEMRKSHRTRVIIRWPPRLVPKLNVEGGPARTRRGRPLDSWEDMERS